MVGCECIAVPASITMASIPRRRAWSARGSPVGGIIRTIIPIPGIRGAYRTVSLRRRVFASKMSLPEAGPIPPAQPRAWWAACCSARKSLRMVARPRARESGASLKSENIAVVGERISSCQDRIPEIASVLEWRETSDNWMPPSCTVANSEERAVSRRAIPVTPGDKMASAANRIVCGLAWVMAPSRPAAWSASRAKCRVMCHCAISNTAKPASKSAIRHRTDSISEAPRALAG